MKRVRIWNRRIVPEAAAEQFELILFGVVFDGDKGVAGRFLVVCLLGRFAALIGISHLETSRHTEVS